MTHAPSLHAHLGAAPVVLDDTGLPAGPRKPAILQIADYLRDPVAHVQRCRERFGPVFTMRWPNTPTMVYFAEPRAICEIFRAPPEDLRGGRANAVLDFVAGPQSVARLDGCPHRKRRRQEMPPFARVEGYAGPMSDNTLQVLGEIGPEPVSFSEISQDLALRNLIRCTLGFEDAERAAQVHAHVLELMRGALNPVMATLWTAMDGVKLRETLVRRLAPLAGLGLSGVVPFVGLAQTVRELDALIYEELAVRRAKYARGGEPEDVLGILVNGVDDDGEPMMSDGALRDEMMSVLVGGHETASTMMDWFVVEAFSRPEVLRRLREEVDAVVGQGPVTAAMLPHMPYLEAVIDECLRLHPPVPAVGRYVARETTIAGVRLPEGVVASPSILLLHRDPKLWGDPEVFRPERFLDGSVPQGCFIPFGGGTRICLGRTFALFQLKVVLATLISRFELAPRDWTESRLVQRGLFTGVSHPVLVEVRPR